MSLDKENQLAAPTRSAFVWTKLLNIPFWVLLGLLPIILYKDLNISPWMIAAMIVIKPASALFASYWSNWIHDRQDRLVSNLIWGNILRYAPFLFLPWIDSAWLIIVFFGSYMMLSRGVIPAWMEIFKLNFESNTRSKVFSYGSALDYLITAILPLGMGLILDDYSLSWRILFPLSAVLGLASTFFLLKLPRKLPPKPIETSETEEVFSLKDELLKPWKLALNLLKTRPDFAQFQWGFVLGGAGLMVMQPVIPVFFVDILNLSYTKMLLAMAVCKAIGYAIASPTWINLFHRWNIYTVSGIVSILSVFFGILIVASQFHPFIVYFAYILYGIMQAGSELTWQMSGPIFSNDKESSPYSMTNVLLVGVRGCLAPPLGSLLFTMTNSTNALILGSFFCLLSALHLLRYKSKAPELEAVK